MLHGLAGINQYGYNMNVMISVGKQCNNLSELRNIETDYFPVWVIDQNDNQYRIGQEYKTKAYNKIFEYLVANNIFAEDYNGQEEKVADAVISLLQKRLDCG